MADLDDEDLEAISARTSAALDGPWWSSWEGRDHISGDSFIGTGSDDDRGPDMYVTTDDGPAPMETLDFISNARQDIPRLVAEVKRLRSLHAGPTPWSRS
jgi:hypothetical protein